MRVLVAFLSGFTIGFVLAFLGVPFFILWPVSILCSVGATRLYDLAQRHA